MIKTEVLAYSETPRRERIATIVVTFPRYILAELNTHRMFSRNSASSRAIPFNKMLKTVWENPFIPIAFQKDHSGMQGSVYFTNKFQIFLLRNLWLFTRNLAIVFSWLLSKVGLTKQLCNRLLEPFMWHTAIITATEWENFFHLRCPQYKVTGKTKIFRSKKDLCSYYGVRREYYSDLEWLYMNKGQAEIHIMALAESIWDALRETKPKLLHAGEWHIPFGDRIEEEQLYHIIKKESPEIVTHYSQVKDSLFQLYKVKVATARCARVSYTIVGEENKKPNYENDIKLHDRLAKSGHWSPFEHCAQSLTEQEFYNINNSFLVETMNGPFSDFSGNLKGFKQYRKMFKNENITE